MAGCASFEATLAGNIDLESNTYEIAMGYNKEDAFNLLTFGNIGFLLENDNAEKTLVFTVGLEYEHYFTDIVGISGRLGYRYKELEYKNYYGDDSWEYDDKTIGHQGFMLQLGFPFSWSYGKVTPYIGVTFYEEAKFNLGISLALRNQAVAITFAALGAAGQQWNEAGKVYDSSGRHVGTIYVRDREKEQENQKIAGEAIVGIMGGIVEDKMPYPAWKWRPQYEGIYWEYVDGNISEITKSERMQRQAEAELQTANLGIDEAIGKAGQKLNNDLPEESIVAVLSIVSNNGEMSAYVAEKLESQLASSGKFTIVDRNRLVAIRIEQNFQMFSDVSDTTAVSIGQMLGANIVLTGSISGVGSSRRLSISALDVRTSEIVSMVREEF